MAQAAASTCEICTGGPGEHYCQQCDQLFCGSCQSSHLRMKISKNHTFSSGPNMNQEEKLLCTEHEEVFLFYCQDCDTPVCRICSVEKHSRHLMTDLTKSTKKFRTQLAKDIVSKVTTSKLNLDKIEKETKTYREEVKAVIKTIIEEGNYWKKLIDEKVDSCVKLVQDDENKAIQTMFALTKVYRGVFESCQQLEKQIKEMETVADVLLLQKLEKLKVDVDNIDLKKVPKRYSVSYRKKKPSGTEIDILFGELKFRDDKVSIETSDNQQNTRDLDTDIKAREEVKNRLSEMMGKQMKNNNPVITDLNDPDRPLRIVEKFSNVFDNEWTDTIDEIELVTGNEIAAIKILRSVVIETYLECFDLRHKGNYALELQNRGATVQIKVNEIADEYKIQLKKMKSNQLQHLKQGIMQKIAKSVDGKVLSCLSQSMKQYLEKCLEVCWVMVCHSPPIHLHWAYKGHPFDLHILRPYTESGDVVDYIIWPVMFLHEDGPLLCKGVAQGRNSKHYKQGRSSSKEK